MPDKKPAVDTTKTPIPNYGRAAAYGLAAALIGGVAWAAFQALTGIYTIIMAAAAGWLCGTCVKRGMGAVSRTGILLSFYFTAMTVFLGEYFLFAWYHLAFTGRLSPGGAMGMLAAYYQADIMRLVIMLLFTLTGMVIAMIYSR
jgi:hypothetical protein